MTIKGFTKYRIKDKKQGKNKGLISNLYDPIS